MKKNNLITIGLIILAILFSGLAAFLVWSINTRSVAPTDTSAASKLCTDIRDSTYSSCMTDCKSGNQDCTKVLDGTYDSCFSSCTANLKDCTKVLDSSWASCNDKCKANGGSASECGSTCETSAKKDEASCKADNESKKNECAGSCGDKARAAESSCKSNNKSDEQCAGECGTKARDAEALCTASGSQTSCSDISDGTGVSSDSCSSSSITGSTQCSYSNGSSVKTSYCCPKGEIIGTYKDGSKTCINKVAWQGRCDGVNTTMYSYGINSSTIAKVGVVNCTSSVQTYTCEFKQYHCNSANGTSSGECSETLVYSLSRNQSIETGKATDTSYDCDPGACGSCQADVSCFGSTDGIFKTSGVDCSSSNGGGSGTATSTTPVDNAPKCNGITISQSTLAPDQTAIITMKVTNPSNNEGRLVVFDKDCNGTVCPAKIRALDADRNSAGTPVNSALMKSEDGTYYYFITPGDGNGTFQWAVSYKHLFGTSDNPVIDSATGKELKNVQFNGWAGGLGSTPSCVTGITKVASITATPASSGTTPVTTVTATTVATTTITTSATITNTVTEPPVTNTSISPSTTSDAQNSGNLPAAGLTENPALVIVFGIIFTLFGYIIYKRRTFEDKVVDK